MAEATSLIAELDLYPMSLSPLKYSGSILPSSRASRQSMSNRSMDVSHQAWVASGVSVSLILISLVHERLGRLS